MHSKRHCDVRCLAKRSMLGGIMTFTEMVDTIAKEGEGWLHIGFERRGCSQVTNYNMHRRWWVIRRDRDMTTGFMTCLRQFTYC